MTPAAHNNDTLRPIAAIVGYRVEIMLGGGLLIVALVVISAPVLGVGLALVTVAAAWSTRWAARPAT